MSRDTGNIRYLKPIRSVETPSTSFEDLIHKLEQRIEGIEKKVENHGQIDSKKLGSNLNSLVQLLEEKIQKISNEILSHPEKKSSSFGSTSQFILESLEKFRKLLTTQEIFEILKSLWFGERDENYEVDEFGLDPFFMKKVKPLFDFLYYNYWRVSVDGLKNIPAHGQGLIVSNHSGTLPYDGTMIAASIMNDHVSRRDVRFLVEDFVYHFPFLGTLMYRIGGVRACPENAERLLSKGHLVTVFPEGIKGIGKHYKNRYHLQRFGRGGFIKLALKTNTPIIPTAVIGAEEIHPLLYKSTVLARPLGIPYIPITPTLPWLGPLGLIPLPSKWKIIFGAPIHFNNQDPEDQLLVNRLSEMVRGKIQEMIVEALKNRRSIWFG